MSVGVGRSDELRRFLGRLGLTDLDLELADQALTHRSYANEIGGRAHNERLEFLGDAVLGMVIADKLFERYPDRPEGALTRLKSRLVSRSTMGRLAHDLGLGEVLLVGKGEELSGGRQRSSTLGNALEALVGCVYLAKGLSPVTELILRLWEGELRAAKDESTLDPKSELQEFLQAAAGTRPSYRIVREDGPDHDKHFVAAVAANGHDLAQGAGKTKKEAEQAAARAALEKVDWHERPDGVK